MYAPRICCEVDKLVWMNAFDLWNHVQVLFSNSFDYNSIKPSRIAKRIFHFERGNWDWDCIVCSLLKYVSLVLFVRFLNNNFVVAILNNDNPWT